MKKAVDTYSSDRLVKALAARHTGDVFVAECKNGPTQTGSHRRLDAWVLVKTWSPITTLGYEIKVSRADWRRDEKLSDYMSLCHLLYLVAPKGVIPIDELPASWGLLEACGPTDRLVMRKKAERRDIELPARLMVYVLMCRARIQREHDPYEHPMDAKHYQVKALQEWVQGKDTRRELHYLIKGRIRQQFDAQEQKLHELERRVRDLEVVERRIVELGFDPTQPVQSWKVSQRLAQLATVISPNLLRTLSHTATELERVKAELVAITTPLETP